MATKNSKSTRRVASKPLTTTPTVKAFILDTNVLIHDPESIFNFQENHVFLPVEVLEELDNFKTEQTERGANARRVHRNLDSLFNNDPQKMSDGVELPNGGRLSVVINTLSRNSGEMVRLFSLFPDGVKKDNRILASAVYVSTTQPPPVVVVTKDVNMRLKALALGMQAEDYLTDKKNVVVDTKHTEVIVADNQFQRFYNEGRVTVTEQENIPVNEYVVLVNETQTNHRAPARHYGNGEFRKLLTPHGVAIPRGVFLKPRSFEQSFLMDAILDPSISLVTVAGKAGTGKTLVSIGTALSLINTPDSPYDGITISRPVVAMGKDLGALPGGIDEKLRPWLQPYHDALNILMPSRRAEKEGNQNQPPQGSPDSWTRMDRKHFRKSQQRQNQENKGQNRGPGQGNGHASVAPKPWELLQQSGVLEIEALQYIRGRSIPRRVFILDESQQLTPHEAKTVVTRMSEGSKVILMGDPAQIDNPFVDSRSNGLIFTQSKMRNQKIAAHVRLFKGERSALAELASSLM